MSQVGSASFGFKLETLSNKSCGNDQGLHTLSTSGFHSHTYAHTCTHSHENMYTQRHAHPTHIPKQRLNEIKKMSILHTSVVNSCMWLVTTASTLLILNTLLTSSEYQANSALDWFPVRRNMVSRSQELYNKSSLGHITKVSCDDCRAIQLETTLGCVPIAWIYFIVSLNCNQVARCYSFPKQSITPSIHGCQPREFSKHSSGTSLVYSSHTGPVGFLVC